MLVIAKLDRLARNVHFISGLMNSDVEFVAVDMPSANRLTIHILAAVAEHESEMISQRTKAALAAAKARGNEAREPESIGGRRHASQRRNCRSQSRSSRPGGTIEKGRDGTASHRPRTEPVKNSYATWISVASLDREKSALAREVSECLVEPSVSCAFWWCSH